MKGRPRDPTRARRQTGHRRKPGEAPALKAVPALPAGKRTKEPPPPILVAPPDLPEKLRPYWDRVVAVLGPGTRDMDVMGIEALVRQYARMKQLGDVVENYGVVARRPNGDVVVSPFVKGERDATAAFLRLAEHYGLTLAARMRLGLMQLAGQTLAQALAESLET